jgi:hypothetical protein
MKKPSSSKAWSDGLRYRVSLPRLFGIGRDHHDRRREKHEVFQQELPGHVEEGEARNRWRDQTFYLPTAPRTGCFC